MSLKVTQTAEQKRKDEQETETCPYCGQMSIDPRFCGCEGSQRAARIAQSRQSAHEQVRNLFLTGRSYGFESDVPQNVLMLLYSAVDAVADDIIMKAAVSITPFSQAIICTDSKGLIKVQRKDVKDVALSEQA